MPFTANSSVDALESSDSLIQQYKAWYLAQVPGSAEVRDFFAAYSEDKLYDTQEMLARESAAMISYQNVTPLDAEKASYLKLLQGLCRIEQKHRGQSLVHLSRDIETVLNHGYRLMRNPAIHEHLGDIYAASTGNPSKGLKLYNEAFTEAITHLNSSDPYYLMALKTAVNSAKKLKAAYQARRDAHQADYWDKQATYYQKQWEQVGAPAAMSDIDMFLPPASPMAASLSQGVNDMDVEEQHAAPRSPYITPTPTIPQSPQIPPVSPGVTGFPTSPAANFSLTSAASFGSSGDISPLLVALGNDAYANQDYETALQHYTSAINSPLCGAEARKGAANVWQTRAAEHYQNELYVSAADAYKKALSYEPTNIDIKFSLGLSLFWGNRNQEAYELFQEVKKTNPDYASIDAMLGYCLEREASTGVLMPLKEKAQKYEQAFKNYVETSKKDSISPCYPRYAAGALYKMGSIFLENNQFTEAKQSYDTALIWLQEAAKRANATQDKEELADISKVKGDIYRRISKRTGNPTDKVEEYLAYQEARKYSSNIPDIIHREEKDKQPATASVWSILEQNQQDLTSVPPVVQALLKRTYSLNHPERADSVLREYMTAYNNPDLKEDLTLLAMVMQSHPKFNIRLIDGKEVSAYKPSLKNASAYYNTKKSIVLACEDPFFFTREDMAVLMHEASHLLENVKHHALSVPYNSAKDPYAADLLNKCITDTLQGLYRYICQTEPQAAASHKQLAQAIMDTYNNNYMNYTPAEAMIINTVLPPFLSYKEHEQATEIVVRVPQLLGMGFSRQTLQMIQPLVNYYDQVTKPATRGCIKQLAAKYQTAMATNQTTPPPPGQWLNSVAQQSSPVVTGVMA